MAFVSGGAIWTVPAAGGEAHLLISDSADQSRPLYSPSGKEVAFISNRNGNAEVYLLNLDTSSVKRLTHDDETEQLDSWSADGKWIYFSTTSHDIGDSLHDIYRVRSDGGTPMPVVAERYVNEFAAAPNPDGKSLAFCRGGDASNHWWRRGHCHSDECEIWLRESGGKYRLLTDYGAVDLWPEWSPDGSTLYYVSDRGGTQNLWVRPKTGASRQLTGFHDGRVLWPSLCANGKTIVFERDFALWKLDLANGGAEPIPIRLRGAAAVRGTRHHQFTKDVSELAVSHDGKKLAFVVHGQVFASAADGGKAFSVTHSDAIESRVAWAHDGRRLAYVSTRDGRRHIYLYDFADQSEKRVTSGPGDDTLPHFSPDDSKIAFQRDGKELCLVDLASHRESVLARQQYFDRPPFDNVPGVFDFSPAGDWIVFLGSGPKGFRNLHVVATDGTSAAPREISFLANVGSNAVAWTPDGTELFFGTGQRMEDFNLARLDLTLRTPRFKEDQFRDLFKEEPHDTLPQRPPQQPTRSVPQPAPATMPTTRGAPATQPAQPATSTSTRIDFDDIDQRLSMLPVGVDVDDLTISPDGKWVAVLAHSAARQNVYAYPIDPSISDPVLKQLTATSGDKGSIQFAPDPSNSAALPIVYYIEDGQIHSVLVDGSSLQDHAITVEMDIDFDRQKRLVFDQAWRYIHEQFHDPNFNGIDWDEVRSRYAPRIAAAQTPAEERRLLNLMVGELNASHLGAYPPARPPQTVGRLGLEFDAQEYERSGRLKVTSVLPLGPAAVACIPVGSVLVAVGSTPIDRSTNLDALLDHQVGHEVTLAFIAPGGTDRQTARILPIDAAAEETLMYRAWVKANRQYVLTASHGRLGYVHLADMSAEALTRLDVDLDSINQQKQGVVIDVRNNEGGFVNGHAIDVFSRHNYITFNSRGFPPISGRAGLGQRFLEAPTILVTNRGTFSDGEDFTEGYQSLHLGDTVGEPTAGGILFTDDVTLLDGTRFRLPTDTVLGSDGQPMEMHPRPVRFLVQHPPGESEAGRDSQLDVAVRELLRKIDVNAPSQKLSHHGGTEVTEKTKEKRNE